MKVWYCEPEQEIWSPADIELFSDCRRDPRLYNLDEQDDVYEFNMLHEKCGWYLLTPLKEEK